MSDEDFCWLVILIILVGGLVGILAEYAPLMFERMVW